MKIHLWYNAGAEAEMVSVFATYLKRIGFKCEIAGDASKPRDIDECLIVSWDWDTVYKKITRGAGAPIKSTTKTASPKDIRKRMENETAEEIASSLGISRATLFRRLKRAEEKGRYFI